MRRQTKDGNRRYAADWLWLNVRGAREGSTIALFIPS